MRNDPRQAEPASAETANEAFKASFSNRVSAGLVLAVALHVGFLHLFPQLRAADVSPDGDEMRTIELPTEIVVPPPPERVARPATPLVAETDIDDDITIPRTDVDYHPVSGPPAPPPTGSATDRPAFIPRDVEPRLQNEDEVRRLLQRHYPSALRDAGIGRRVVLWLFVGSDGRVGQIEVRRPSGYPAFDAAAVRVARSMEFAPAVNQDRSVGVWISQAVEFRVR